MSDTIFHTIAIDLNTCWQCPQCGYWPSNSSIPHDQCGNCGTILKRDAAGEGITTVVARPTFKGSRAIERVRQTKW